MGTVLYSGKEYETLSLGEALLRQERATKSGKHLAVISAKCYGCERDEYFLTPARMSAKSTKPPINQR